jgi:hypothetical protein
VRRDFQGAVLVGTFLYIGPHRFTWKKREKNCGIFSSNMYPAIVNGITTIKCLDRGRRDVDVIEKDVVKSKVDKETSPIKIRRSKDN